MRLNKNIKEIFDPIRKKWFFFTPEEWVRQSWVIYLMEFHKVSTTQIAIEKKIKTVEGLKRFDLLVYENNTTQPYFLLECKAPNVALTDEVIMQAISYNRFLNANIIAISNGKENYAFNCLQYPVNEVIELSFFN